jgi:hypothetical protein
MNNAVSCMTMKLMKLGAKLFAQHLRSFRFGLDHYLSTPEPRHYSNREESQGRSHNKWSTIYLYTHLI